MLELQSMPWPGNPVSCSNSLRMMTVRVNDLLIKWTKVQLVNEIWWNLISWITPYGLCLLMGDVWFMQANGSQVLPGSVNLAQCCTKSVIVLYFYPHFCLTFLSPQLSPEQSSVSSSLFSLQLLYFFFFLVSFYEELAAKILIWQPSKCHNVYNVVSHGKLLAIGQCTDSLSEALL